MFRYAAHRERRVTSIALVLSLLLAALGALGIASPQRFVSVVRFFETSTGLYLAAALRGVLGVALLFSAPISHAPEVLSIAGVIFIVAGIIALFYALQRSRKPPRLLAGTGVGVRGWAAVTSVLGLSLAYALAP